MSRNWSPVSNSWGPSLGFMYITESIAIYRVLSHAAEIAIGMDPSPRCDVTFYYLVSMTQTRHVILCPLLPRDPDDVIVGKYEV